MNKTFFCKQDKKETLQLPNSLLSDTSTFCVAIFNLFVEPKVSIWTVKEPWTPSDWVHRSEREPSEMITYQLFWITWGGKGTRELYFKDYTFVPY